MTLLEYICIALVGVGTLVLMTAIRSALQVNKSVPQEFTFSWKVISLLMACFLGGYIGFIFLQFTHLSSVYLETIASFVFFGGALFVLLVINLSSRTITRLTGSRDEIDAVNAELRVKSYDLEQKYSELVHAEKELRNAKAALENIFNSSIPICITSLDQDIIDSNEAYNATFGKPGSKGIGTKCYESRPGSTCHTEHCPLTRIIAGDKETVGECSKIQEDGRIRYFIFTARPYLDSDGELLGIVESFQDITRRKSAEKLLALEKERLAITLQSIGDGVITTDLEGRVLMLNRVAESLCGWTMEEALNKPLEDVFHVVDFTTRKRIDNPVTRVIKSGSPVHITPGAVLVASDGWERFIANSAAPILDQQGNIVGVVLVFRDISEKRKLESEVTKLEKLKAVGLLAGGIAHDFNNLLTAILGNISLARLDTQGNARAAERLDNAELAVMKAKGLTQQLLTFSKGGSPQKKIINFGEVLRESVEFSLRGSTADVTFDISPDLLAVEADSGQISQAINNMVINAQQAMPKGGTLAVRAMNCKLDGKDPAIPLAPGHYVKASFTDQGVGIPKDHLTSIFDPYFTTKIAGSGLGLSTVFSIIKRHDGHITVESRPGEGTTFTVYLPASSDEPVPEQSASSDINRGSGRVLVMDDDQPIREFLGMMLTELGYNPSFVANGQEALAAYQEAMENDPFDCVILDLTIPGGMGGRETIAMLAEVDPGVRAIVSSGYSNDPVIADHTAYGFKGSVNKPYSIHELADALRKVIAEPA